MIISLEGGKIYAEQITRKKGFKMIIDSHAHIFPEKIAAKASVNIGRFYDLHMEYDGTVRKLLEAEAKAGVDKAIVQSVATVPEQVVSINTFISEQVAAHSDKLIGFAAIHPDYEDIEGEVKRARRLGLKGMKIHPDFQKFCIDDKRAYKMYEAIEGVFPLLVHTGDFRYDFSKPARMARVIADFPKLDVIAAHFGGWSEWDDAARCLCGKRLWIDTSSSLYAISPDRARQLISSFGEDRVLFGTDYPMWSPSEELERISKLNLSEKILEKILHKNIEQLIEL